MLTEGKLRRKEIGLKAIAQKGFHLTRGRRVYYKGRKGREGHSDIKEIIECAQELGGDYDISKGIHWRSIK